jgi:hypothetical protein
MASEERFSSLATMMQELSTKLSGIQQTMSTTGARSSTPIATPIPHVENVEIQPTVEPTPSYRMGSTPAYEYHHKKTRVAHLDPLDDGEEPTFIQWRASIRDRLEFNADHYRTINEAKAMIWSATKGLARRYLEPRYITSSDGNKFKDQHEMIELLASYFLTGHEVEDARHEFRALQMADRTHPNESFVQFRARFQNLAVHGEVPDSELFYSLWEKITPQLRNSATPLKRGWNMNLNTMIEDLISLDKERRWNADLNASKTHTTPSTGATSTVKKTTFSSSKVSKAPTGSNTYVAPQVPRLYNPNLSKGSDNKDSAQTRCYNCNEMGHFKKDCPHETRIKLIEASDTEFPPASESNEDSEGNEEA